jgi:hypothetical protein
MRPETGQERTLTWACAPGTPSVLTAYGPAACHVDVPLQAKNCATVSKTAGPLSGKDRDRRRHNVRGQRVLPFTWRALLLVPDRAVTRAACRAPAKRREPERSAPAGEEFHGLQGHVDAGRHQQVLGV